MAGEPALFVTIVVVGMIFGATCNSWEDLLRRGRPAFLLGAILIVLLLPPSAALVFLLLGLVGFYAFWWQDDGRSNAEASSRPWP